MPGPQARHLVPQLGDLLAQAGGLHCARLGPILLVGAVELIEIAHHATSICALRRAIFALVKLRSFGAALGPVAPAEERNVSALAKLALLKGLALPMLVLTALFQVPDGVQAIAMSILRGLNDTRAPGMIAIGSFWITGVAVGTLAGHQFALGPSGVWGGLLIGLSVAALLLTFRMRRALRRVRDGGRILVA